MTKNQEILLKMLPPHYHKLCELPDNICEQLATFAHYVTGDGIYAIQARVKLEQLLKMSNEEIIKAFESVKSNI